MMNVPNLEMGSLRAFVTVTETRGFTAASQRLNYSQSSISKQINRLEEMVGARLFDRTSRQLDLTPEGKELYRLANRMLEIHDQVVQSFANRKAVRLGLASDFGAHPIQHHLARFQMCHPDVKLQLTMASGRELKRMHDVAAIDAIIVRSEDAELEGRRLWSEPFVWMAGRHFRDGLDETVPLIVLAAPSAPHQSAIEILQQRGRSWKIACVCESLASARSLAAAGFGVTLLGRSFVEEGLQVFSEDEGWSKLPDLTTVILGEERLPSALRNDLAGFRETDAGTGSVSVSAHSGLLCQSIGNSP